ncbi:Regulator of G protein signaling superfamily [Apiospora arundinis]
MSTDDEQRPSPLIIPELLEAILLYVDERTLLVSAQRVSQHWRAVIAVSPSLQWKLFLRPDDRAATALAPRKNPLLAKAFPFCFDDWPNGVLLTPQNGTRALLWAKSDTTAAEPPVLGRRRANPWYPLPQWPHLRARREAFRRPDASWRRMLVHQPPVLLSNVLTPMWDGLSQKWIHLKPTRTPTSGEHGGERRPAATPCRMQDLVGSIFRGFRARLDEGSNTFAWAEIESDHDPADGDEGDDGDEDVGLPNVAGFKVIWNLQGPTFGKRRRAVEEAHGLYHDTGSKKAGVPRQHVLVLHDVEIGNVAPQDRHFGQLKEILFSS